MSHINGNDDHLGEEDMMPLPPASPKARSSPPRTPPYSPRSTNTNQTGNSPHRSVMTPQNLGEAPVEREAGMQIMKAWQEIERKAAQKVKQQDQDEGDTDDEEEQLFATLEDDDDAVVLSRLRQTKKEQEGKKLKEELQLRKENPTTKSNTKAKLDPPFPAGAEKNGNNDPQKNSSQRSLPKKKKMIKSKSQHRRAESVEQAMFGVLIDGAENSAVRSSQVHLLQDSPLQATEQLIHSAQTRVQDLQSQQQARKKKRGQHVLVNNNDGDSDEEEEEDQELNKIINQNGDRVEEDGLNKSSKSNNMALNRIEEGDSEEEEDDSEEDELDSSHQQPQDEESGKKRRRGKRKRLRHKSSKVVRHVTTGVQQDWALFQQFLTPRKTTIFAYLKFVGCLIMLPSLTIAALLFYLKEQPDQQDKLKGGSTAVANDNDDETPFVSWWFLFIGVRQIVTLTLALITQALLIDYVALGSRFSLKYMGPAVTLLAVQARGWPCVLTFWAIYDLVLLSGDRALAHHWLYFQDYINLFNANNHSGNIVQSAWNFRILVTAAVVGVVVAIKRVILGLFLARKTLSNFGDEFEDVKKDMIVIGELATLAMEIQIQQRSGLLPAALLRPDHSVSSLNLQTIKKSLLNYNRSAETEDAAAKPNPADAANAFVSQWNSSNNNNAINAGVPSSVVTVGRGEPELDSLTLVAEEPGDDDLGEEEEAEIAEMLDEWEGAEDRLERKKQKTITLGSILRFYKEITIMKRRYPFLPVFGRADTRDKCIRSAQRVYDRLMLRTPSMRKLPFSTIALLAKNNEDGRMDKQKLKELIRVFRPDRDGKISKLDFVKSVDTIYRDLRKLSLNIEDNVQIDKAVELLFNVIFYFVVASFVLQQLGVDPFQLFASIFPLIISIGFIIGASSAKWLEGILFILGQRPYGVGDRIHLSNPASETSANGSSGWIVEKVTLTTTTVYWGATNERATLRNGAIANLRVINAARSPKAVVYVPMKFGIDTHLKKIQVFRSAAEQFLKQRPREWAAFIGFRPSEVVIDRGYISYTLIAQHREGWQKIGAILGSKANLTTFLLEVSKQLEMRFLQPPLPIDLKIEDASAALRAAGLKRQDMGPATAAGTGSVATFF